MVFNQPGKNSNLNSLEEISEDDEPLHDEYPTKQDIQNEINSIVQQKR